MAQIMEIWADSGETVERDRTISEQLQYESDQRMATELAAAQIAAAAKAQVATVAAIDHAKSLGFTDDMIAVMYPNLLPETSTTKEPR
jgi:hypothetical protein